jgi:predicted AAA+ superfamily ATPase
MTLKKTDYKPRLADIRLENLLQAFGAVCIEGPKWCGKTWTALNAARSVAYIASPENNFQNRALAQLSPNLVLEGDAPRLIDEWQEVPPIWDAVNFSVNQQTTRGCYILTGSATPNYKGVLHSGAGRIAKIQMLTMSLLESGDSGGQVSLKALFDGGFTPQRQEPTTLEQLIHLIVRGGWPGSLGLPAKAASELPRAYLSSIITDDLHRIDGSRKDQQKVYRLLRSLARNESTVVSNATLRRDIQDVDGETINEDTIADYLNLLQRMFLRNDQPAFDPNMRSSVRVGKSVKRHFVDPSLAVAAMEISGEMLGKDLNTLGFLFEALCERDLQIYAADFQGKHFHYRDGTGREIDAVVEHPDGSWAAIEIKLGGKQVDQASENLVAIRAAMENSPGAKPPKVLCVLCGLGEYAYQREDGVFVVPITMLKN